MPTSPYQVASNLDFRWSNLSQPGAPLAQTMTHELARRAFEASVDRHSLTPYSRDATEYFDMVYSGGKKDDITVVVAVMR